MSLPQKIISHTESHSAPRSITQNGIPTSQVTPPDHCMTSTIAASGHIAFATSLAQCAKLSKATANTRGMLKR